MSDSNNLPSTYVLPEHMRGDGVMGNEELVKFVQPPRLLIVQALSGPPLDKHEPGTLLLMPSERVILPFVKGSTGSEKPMLFVPIFFFNEYVIANPREIHASHGRARERTFDANSEIARRAMSRDKAVRECPCPEKLDKQCKYMVRMNYLWWILSGEDEEPVSSACLVTLKSTEANAARSLNSLIQARRAPLFGCVFAASVAARSNQQGKWHGYEFNNPPVGTPSFVEDAGMYEHFKQAHLDAKQAFEQQLFDLDSDDETDGSRPANTDF